jgi:hypothetical protein
MVFKSMKSTEQIIDLIAWKIGLIYHHNPLAYGGSPDGVENLMHVYHELWSEIVERQKEYRDVMSQVYCDEECSGFAVSYRFNHPNAGIKEVTDYVVSHWRKISDSLGVPIPHEAIIKDLKKSYDTNGS